MDAVPIPPIQSTPLLCPQCHQPVTAEEYFCPNCGFSLKAKPPSTRWWSQLYVYAVSLFLPPLGLWPAWKYLRHSDLRVQRVGWIAVGLTTVGVVVSILLFQSFLAQFNQSLNAASGGLLGS